MTEKALRTIHGHLAADRTSEALQAADRAVRSIDRQQAKWGRETCECACAHKRRDPCKFTLTGKSTDCCLPCGVGY